MRKARKRKIISLNLVLVLILLAALPTGAAETVETGSQSLEKAALLAQRLEQITAPAGEERAELSAEEPYLVRVGETVFDSDQDKSGAGWTYTAADHTLTLDNYRDSGIAASGDLVIYANGENTVAGKDGGNYFGQSGIIVEGELEINVQEGNSLRVDGGDARSTAGSGIRAMEGLTCWVNGDVFVTGGDVTASQAYGGDAIFSPDVFLFGDGHVTVSGGFANATGSLGGYGIFGNYVYVGVDCDAFGGWGYYGGDGINFGAYCSISAIEGYFSGGLASSDSYFDGSPIRCETSDVKWYYNSNTTLMDSGRILTITVNEYTMSISGNGGQRNGRASFSDTQKYPHGYNLSDYIFQRDKYTQVGWRDSGGFVGLDDYYLPTANTYLSAEWIMVDPGDIVINSLSDTLDDGSHYRSQRTALTLPSQTTGQYSGTQDVLGWSSTLSAEPDPSTKVMQGVWYEGGSVVQPDKNSVQLLYARSAAGKYVRYHPNGGTLPSGGTIMVQGTTATALNLEVYAMDGSAMTAPQGCKFRGWSRAADVDAIRYTAGESISLPAMAVSEIIDLYAVWEQVEFIETIEPGAQVRSNVEDGTVTVELTQAWCQEKGGQTVIAAGLTSGGVPKLLRTAVASCGAGDMQLTFQCSPQTPTQVKLFVLDENLAPVCARLETTVFSPQGQS